MSATAKFSRRGAIISPHPHSFLNLKTKTEIKHHPVLGLSDNYVSDNCDFLVLLETAAAQFEESYSKVSQPHYVHKP